MNLAVYIPRHIYRGRQSRARRFTSDVTQSGRNVASRIQGALARVNFELSYVRRGVSRHRCIPLQYLSLASREKSTPMRIFSALTAVAFFLYRAAPVRIYGALSAASIRSVSGFVCERTSSRRAWSSESQASLRARLRELSTIGWSLRKIATGAAAGLSLHSTAESRLDAPRVESGDERVASAGTTECLLDSRG